MITGAPQWHDQNYTKRLSAYQTYGRRYNTNYGYLNGEYLSERRNYYHKPVANLNWDFNISDKSQLSTVLYASWGRGGGTGNVGSSVRHADGYINWDAIKANNEASATGASTYALRASVNNHAWYGLVTNFNHEISENLDWNVGFDLRSYKGTHFRQIVDLLGADYFQDNGNVRFPGGNQITATYKANPWSALSNFAEEGERYAWDYDERINYGGLFTQLEYAKDGFSAFVQGSISSQSHIRWDRYQYLPADEESEKVTNSGFNIKGGTSYQIDDQNIVYFNTGYYSRQPYHDNIYLNFGNDVNPLTENEKIFGLEAGYSLRLNGFTANVNLYRTSWKDRVVTSSNFEDDILTYTSNFGVEQLHSGVEVDFKARPTTDFSLRGFLSIGNWEYKGASITRISDEDRNIISEEEEDVDGGKVGDAAQFTFGLGADYNVTDALSLDADYRYYDKLYARVGAVKENLELPSFGLMDMGATYKIIKKAGNKGLSLRVNVNNVFHKIYISELTSNIALEAGDTAYQGINVDNFALFGLGRTWNAGLRYNF